MSTPVPSSAAPRYREPTAGELRTGLLPADAFGELALREMTTDELAYPDPGLFGNAEVSPAYCYGPAYPDHRGVRVGQLATNADRSVTVTQVLVAPYAGSGLEPITAAVLPRSCPEADLSFDDGTTVHARLAMLTPPGIGDSSAVRRNDNDWVSPQGTRYTSTILTAFATSGSRSLMVATIVYDAEPDVVAFLALVRQAFDHAAEQLDQG